ncbi:MAG: selenium-dependent molybdenum cofactor biosynthesis protein YqeB, partial [Dehalococcoidia bacterium]
MPHRLRDLVVLIKGGGEIGTAVAHRLARSHLRVCITEAPHPLAVARETAFCEAVYDGEKEVGGVIARLVTSPAEIPHAWREERVPVLVDPETSAKDHLHPHVLVDAIMAKRNLGTRISDAPLVIGLGPGFEAGKDAHVVIETNNSNNLGRVILQGKAEANTGIPIPVGGHTFQRTLHAPHSGLFHTKKRIGDSVSPQEVVGWVDQEAMAAEIGGTLRGLVRDGIIVEKGVKVGEIDPLARAQDCREIRALPRAVAGGV